MHPNKRKNTSLNFSFNLNPSPNADIKTLRLFSNDFKILNNTVQHHSFCTAGSCWLKFFLLFYDRLCHHNLLDFTIPTNVLLTWTCSVLISATDEGFRSNLKHRLERNFFYYLRWNFFLIMWGPTFSIFKLMLIIIIHKLVWCLYIYLKLVKSEASTCSYETLLWKHFFWIWNIFCIIFQTLVYAL